MSGFQLLLWAGAGVTMIGVIGLMWTAITTNQLRQSRVPDAEMRRALQKGALRNMVALFIAALGLMMVVIGILLD